MHILDDDHKPVLRDFVLEWINEGFTTPPYTKEQYDIFEWLGITDDSEAIYDVRRPE